MSDIVIRIENLSKQYRLGTVGSGTLHEDLNRWWHRVRGKEDPYLKIGETNDRTHRGNSEYVWALRDINLEVKQGEVLGIIGKNGAGKSTLLKILSKVTGPTKGQIMAKGRIASLLEVGTGFHHELTGRENIFLNGALLGMTKYEVNRKLDEIVDFAGVERYLDTPVKRYSSGMTVRLGFAVAAHLDPEILIVDEVLAVGDAEFQKKSIGKMESVNKSGRTILFVSHQMDMIKALCNKTALLTDGVLKSVGGTDQIIQEYIQFESDKNPSSAQITTPLNPEVPIQILSIGLKDITGNFKKSFEVFEDVFLEIEHLTKEPTIGAIITFEVFRNESPVFVSFDTDQNPELLDNRLTGRFISLIKIPKKFLKPGNYKIEANAGIANSRIIHKIPTPLRFEITLLSKPSTFLSFAHKRKGVVVSPAIWKTKKL